MNSRVIILLALLLPAWAHAAAPLKYPLLKVGSGAYTNVTVLGFNASDLYFTHAGGIANVKLRLLTPDMQKEFGYDSNAALEAERKQAEQEVLYQGTLAEAIQARKQQEAQAAQQAERTSEESLADAISDKSLLGKAAPSLQNVKWIGDKPESEGKFLLVGYLTSWSVPCRKWLPELNALQKKFSGKVCVVGLSPEPESELSAFAETAIKFPVGVDVRGEFAAAAGVTSVPGILLVDPQGLVRYQGHPGALSEPKLQALLARFAQ